MKVDIDRTAITPRIVLTEDSGAAPSVALRPAELQDLIEQLQAAEGQVKERPAARCAEHFDRIPTTSDHLWKADLHQIPAGSCLKCGVPFSDYSERQMEAWKRLQRGSSS